MNSQRLYCSQKDGVKLSNRYISFKNLNSKEMEMIVRGRDDKNPTKNTWTGYYNICYLLAWWPSNKQNIGIKRRCM